MIIYLKQRKKLILYSISVLVILYIIYQIASYNEITFITDILDFLIYIVWDCIILDGVFALIRWIVFNIFLFTVAVIRLITKK